MFERNTFISFSSLPRRNGSRLIAATTQHLRQIAGKKGSRIYGAHWNS